MSNLEFRLVRRRGIAEVNLLRSFHNGGWILALDAGNIFIIIIHLFIYCYLLLLIYYYLLLLIYYYLLFILFYYFIYLFF